MLYIFDLGGVIIKTTDLLKVYNKLNLKVDFKTFRDIWYNDPEVIDSHKGLNDENKAFESIIKKIDCKIAVNELLNIVFEEREYYQDTLDIIKDLKEQGKKVYLLSNLRKIDYKYLKKDIDISMFDKTFLSYEMKMLKPEEKIYKAVINELKCNPGEIYFFDDSNANIESANKCGINGFCVTGENIKEVFKKNELGVR